MFLVMFMWLLGVDISARKVHQHVEPPRQCLLQVGHLSVPAAQLPVGLPGDFRGERMG